MGKENKEEIEAGVTIITSNEAQSSVKIEETAGGTRVKVKAYSSNLAVAKEEAIKVYDELRERYKEE